MLKQGFHELPSSLTCLPVKSYSLTIGWLVGVMEGCQTYDLKIVGLTASYQLVTTWMGNCLQTGKPSAYITYT